MSIIISHNSANTWYLQFGTPSGTLNIPAFYVEVDTYNHYMRTSRPIIQVGREVYSVAANGVIPVSTIQSSYSNNVYYDSNINAIYQGVPDGTGGDWIPAVTGPVNAYWYNNDKPSVYGYGGIWYNDPCC